MDAVGDHVVSFEELGASTLGKACGGVFDPAKSDGCTLAADGDWRPVCVAHDECYSNGGTAADKAACDAAFGQGLRNAGMAPGLAWAYQKAVEVGGWHGPWGFGKFGK